MTSTDVEIFKSGLEDLKYYIDGRVSEVETNFGKRFDVIESNLGEIKATLTEMRYELRQQEHDMNHMQTTVYWGFAIMALVIAFIGCVITLAPMLREMYQDRKREKTEESLTRSEVQEMITEAISRTLKS